MSSGRAVALASLGSLVAGVVSMLALHVLPPTDRISPVRSTLSQYALGPSKWIFDVAVLLVAIGSALAFAVLVGSGSSARSPAAPCWGHCGH